MRINQTLTVFLAGLTLSLTGCFDNKVASEQGSGLSEVNIGTPTAENLANVYGPACENAKLTPDTLAKAGGKTGCEAIIALTNDYRLTIEGGSCADGSEATQVAATTGQLNNQNISARLKQNCDYSVKLELGLAGTYYFDNAATWRDNLPRAKVSGDKAQLTVKLRPTEAGRAAGVPESEVEATGFTKLNIKVNFGDNSEPTGPSQNGLRPTRELAAPQDWDGLGLRGDELFELQRLN